MKQPNYTTFYIVRHGQTDWNAAGKVQGHSDIPLNEKGEVQAKNIAKELKHVKFDLAYSSDLMRAQRTAEIIAREHTLAVETKSLLRERNYAEYEGKVMKLMDHFEDVTQELSHQEKYQFKLTQTIESDEELMNRIIPFIRKSALTHPGKTILIGTHGGVLGTLLLHLGYFDYLSRKNFRIANAGYILLRTDGIDFFIDEVIGIEKRT